MVFMRLLVLVTLLAVLGCASESVTVDTPPTSEATVIKDALAGVAETGELGSGMMMVRDGLEKMESTDPEKAEKVSQAVEELKALSTPAERKAKAEEIIGLL